MGHRTQMIVQVRGPRINFDACNRQEEKEIAKDSGKLLSLAIEYKSEFDQAPGKRPSAGTVGTMSEIEKLAHSVKE